MYKQMSIMEALEAAVNGLPVFIITPDNNNPAIRSLTLKIQGLFDENDIFVGDAADKDPEIAKMLQMIKEVSPTFTQDEPEVEVISAKADQPDDVPVPSSEASPTAPDTQPETENQPEKKIAHKKKIDRGKIKALHDAGWSAERIALDMKIGLSTVYKVLSQLRQEASA